MLAIHKLAVKYTSQVYLEAVPHAFTIAAVLAFLRVEKGKQNRWLWLSAVALGIAAASKYSYIPVILIVLLLTGPVIFLLNFVSSWLGIGILLLALGIIIYMRMPVSEVYILSHTPEGRRSAVLGIYYFSAMEGGGVLTPVMGYLIDHLGFFVSFTLAASMIILTTLICGILLRNDLKPEP